MEPIKGFKGFDKDFKCRDFQFQQNATYEEKQAIICERGFHFCTNPFDVWDYYPPCSSRFAEVEGSGKTATHKDDSKIACTNLKISGELTLKGIIQAAVKFCIEIATNNTATGDNGHAAATGDSGHAAATGYSGHAAATGHESIAVSLGIEGRAKGAINNWLTLSEWEYTDKWHIKQVKSVKIEGKKIKADTWYQLIGGKFTEVK